MFRRNILALMLMLGLTLTVGCSSADAESASGTTPTASRPSPTASDTVTLQPKPKPVPVTTKAVPAPSTPAPPPPATMPTPTPEPSEPPTVVYEINGDGGTALQVSWGTMNGLNGYGIEQAMEPALPFRVEVPLEELGRYQTNIFSLNAQDNGAGSFISCKISWKSTGVVLAEQTSTGPYSAVMCSK